MEKRSGTISRVNGPIVEAEDVFSLKMLDMVEVGPLHLIGEVMRLKGGKASIQVYEDTTSLKAGDPLFSRGAPLSVALGPGLLGTIYDGIQRPLDIIRKEQGPFLQRGIQTEALDQKKQWHFTPLAKEGTFLSGGSVIGTVKETSLLLHSIMVPPNISGTLSWITEEGSYTVTEKIAAIQQEDGKSHPLFLSQQWPIRQLRPYLKRLPITQPLITGQRVIDTLFPMGMGGCVAIPGGFGTGKTVTQHQLAKWSEARIVIFVGCGERGNEMTDVLNHFPKLLDPRTQKPLLERTIFIANTSNMPVAAREASIYTGITLAEYYRDMGYNVALMADSTSRWAEALRELAGRLEEMPMEEGFPAYLPSRLAEFYERAGKVSTLNQQEGSITVFASVSPPGGDFSEPVTSHTKRFVRCFWALDKDLANARHYPSISWTESYTEYVEDIKEWFSKNVADQWLSLRYEIMDLLQREEKILQVVKLVGADVLPQGQKLIIEICSLFKTAFLQQSAYDEVDSFSSAKKQFLMLKAILTLYHKSEERLRDGFTTDDLKELSVYQEMLRMKYTFSEEELDLLDALTERTEESLNKWSAQ